MKYLRVLPLIFCLILPLAGVAEEGERVMPEPYASAEHGDPASIPYPAERDEAGYLPAGSAVTSYRVADEKTG